MYHKHKCSLKPEDRKHFLNLRHRVKSKINQAYYRYLEHIHVLGIQSSDQNVSSIPETGQSKFSVKKLFSFLKNSRQYAQGIGLIRDPLTNTYQSANVGKANIINRQFQSTFTPVSPLRLSHLSESTVLDGLADGTITENTDCRTLRPKVPEMTSISISLSGIVKMLVLIPSNLKGSSVSHASSYFSKITRLGKSHLIGKRQLLQLYSKRVTSVTLQTIAQSH